MLHVQVVHRMPAIRLEDYLDKFVTSKFSKPMTYSLVERGEWSLRAVNLVCSC